VSRQSATHELFLLIIQVGLAVYRIMSVRRRMRRGDAIIYMNRWRTKVGLGKSFPFRILLLYYSSADPQRNIMLLVILLSNNAEQQCNATTYP
jgi:hypothetical protein